MMTNGPPSIPRTVLPFPNLARLVGAVLERWPEHSKFVDLRFQDEADPKFPLCEQIAGLAAKLAGDDLPAYCDGYRWMCEAFYEEELYFRRKGTYRLSTFADAYREVYSHTDRMGKYLKGILLSQVLWGNHAEAFRFYVERFLPRLSPGASHLEIGPGHGLFLYFATRAANVASVSAWDVSESSIAMTRKSLQTLGVTRPFHLELQDILERPPTESRFDSVVMSEVLEHLEQPGVALDTVARVLKPGGLAYFNVPINSPAPDHIYLWRSVEDVEGIVREHGFDIVDGSTAPMTGYPLERALRRKVAVSVLVVAQRRST